MLGEKIVFSSLKNSLCISCYITLAERLQCYMYRLKQPKEILYIALYAKVK
nr:MAG TPA: hypothetical protein [Bacteriophage sp.]